MSGVFGCGPPWSQHAQEVPEVALLLLAVLRVEPLVIVFDELIERARGTVREVRRSRRKPAHLLHRDGTDVAALPVDECPTGILRVDDTSEVRMRQRGRFARESEERQVL